jgi:hypothetical protein
MNFLTNVFSAMPLHWWVALIISVLGIAAICVRAFETEEARARRAERNKKKELRSLAERNFVVWAYRSPTLPDRRRDRQ